MVIGLTGGIGCGKSAAAALFAEHGYVHVDADLLARQVLTSAACRSQLVARWGSDCLGPDGSPSRSWIASKVFSEPAELVFLESVTHPEVARLRKLATADTSRSYVVEIPLLFEKNLEEGFDVVICVACSEDVRLQRLAGRGMNSLEAKKRISSQLTLAEKVKKSNFVLWNDGTLEFLKAEVTKLLRQITV
ncbi:MAG: dephospho-CoA kinase [Verrucomicrobia bacterium]|nr:dephospho-CoA kinase [Verrucomicrobiota bacterium]NBS03892.1 dephospho-CoA kinase [Verrucomicrobiota bacterium]NBY36343.1 dephospho-CoA kinase [Verrucomicrobiota bacterium]